MKRGPCGGRSRQGMVVYVPLTGQVVAPVAPRYRSTPLRKELVLDCFRITPIGFGLSLLSMKGVVLVIRGHGELTHTEKPEEIIKTYLQLVT